jgi:uncharacterized paraquat-inducible protein A
MPYDYWTDGEEMQDPKYKRCCYHCREWTVEDVCPNCGFEIEKQAQNLNRGWSLFFWTLVLCGAGMLIAFFFWT